MSITASIVPWPAAGRTRPSAADGQNQSPCHEGEDHFNDEVQGLTKRYGEKTAVDGLTFGIEAGLVTGFLARTEPARPLRCGLSRSWPARADLRSRRRHPGATGPL